MKHKKAFILLMVFLIAIIAVLSGGIYYKNNTPLIYVSYSYEGKVIFSSEYKLSSNFKVIKAYNKKRLSSLYDGLYKSSFNEKKCLDFICPNLSIDLLNLENKVNKRPRNADVVFDKNKKNPFTFIEETYGVSINRQQFIKSVFSDMDSGKVQFTIALPTDSLPPDIDIKSLKDQHSLISTFSTGYATSPDNRKDNIALATSIINGTEIKSGESFSYNSTVGERTVERGFKLAKIISGGQFIEGIGGGVCQVSTTLYNAALLSGVVGVTNRQHHSLPVHYVPLGLDAMVSSENDLSFVNLSLTSIFIIGKTDGSRITFQIYGQKQPYKIKCTSVVDKVIPIPYEEIIDNSNTLISGERRILIQGTNGYKVSSYRNYYEGEKLVKTEIIKEDFYAPKKTIILIGK